MIGHHKIWEFFRKTIGAGRLAQAYLFWGQEGVGKKLFAINLAKALVCEKKPPGALKACENCQSCQMVLAGRHPDVYLLEPGQSEIKIDQIRDLQHRLSLSPFQASYKIAIIDQAQRLNQEAANALLKTLEEPSGRCLIILITTWPQQILPTIISRCQKIRFRLLGKEELAKGLKEKYPKIEEKALRQVVKFSLGRPGLAIKFLENKDLLTLRQKTPNDFDKIRRMAVKERFDYAQWLINQEGLIEFILDSWLIYFRDLLLTALGKTSLTVYQKNPVLPYNLEKIKSLIEKTEQTRLLLANPSFNTRLILENLLIEI